MHNSYLIINLNQWRGLLYDTSNVVLCYRREEDIDFGGNVSAKSGKEKAA